MYRKKNVPLQNNFIHKASVKIGEIELRMDKKEFNNKVVHPTQFSPQERGWLRAMLSKYPHSSVVNVLALLADHAYGFDTPTQRRAVSLTMCNSNGLTTLLNDVKQAVAEPQSFDILNEINTFQEVSFKTAPKSVILSNFLKIATTDEEDLSQEEPKPAETREKKSLATDSLLGTETLAVILEKQGKYDKAISVYENLLARNPEKISIFATRIERLRSLIEANKK